MNFQNSDNCSSLAQAVWRLDDLYKGFNDPAIESDKNWCLNEAECFAKAYLHKVDQLSAAKFHKAVVCLDAIEEKCRKITTFFYLVFAVQSDEPEIARFWQSAREFAGLVRQKTLFFTLEWTRFSDEKAQKILDHPKLADFRYFLMTLRESRAHRLSEPEEKILAVTSSSGREAWTSLFDKVVGRLRFGNQKKPMSVVLNNLCHLNRKTRRQAAIELTNGLENMLPVLTHIFNTIVLDKTLADNLRSYPGWASERNLGNRIDDAVVDARVREIVLQYDFVQRYYQLKKKALVSCQACNVV